jgi:hypothetical protein
MVFVPELLTKNNQAQTGLPQVSCKCRIVEARRPEKLPDNDAEEQKIAILI